METLFYYTSLEIDLTRIEKCLNDEYRLILTDNPPWDRLLFVYYEVSYLNSTIEHHTRWRVLNKEKFDAERPETIDRMLKHFATIVSVDFYIYELHKFIPILQDVLKCFGGYIHFGNKTYNLESIQDFREIEVE